MSAGSWELVAREPHARLRGDVLLFEDYVEHVAAPMRERHLPPLFVPLIVNFGPPYRMLDPLTSAVAAEHASFTGGLGEAVAVTESPGKARCVQVNLTPLGARRLFGVPLHELTDRVVPLSEVLGREVDRLEERLAETRRAGDRLALVESFLRARLADAPPPRPDVSYAWGRLLETGGDIRIGALAAELGCSRKHLAEQFRNQLGLAPKLAALLVRFNRALALVERGVDGAEVAFRCGYADQAHFVKEFRRFSGSTPATFARETQVPFLQAGDEVGA